MGNTMQEHSTNASPVEFGWDFQHNAGILIMLMNIDHARKVRIEGASEDIEVTLDNGKKIFAQAKSVVKYEDFRNVLANLEKSLGTLNAAWKKGNGEGLVYTTNSPNPFNDRVSMMAFSNAPVCLTYDQLPTEKCREKIDKLYLRKKCAFPKEKLAVYVFGFHGDDEKSRYRNVEERVGAFLQRIGLRGKFYWGERALSRWQFMFGKNASKSDQHICISKEEMLWPLIVWVCDANKSDAWVEDFDDAAIEETRRTYKSVIDDVGENFRFVTKVLSSFDEYMTLAQNREGSQRQNVERFISSKWMDFKDDFDLRQVDEDVVKLVVSLAVANVIRSRYEISRIRKEVNL